jgi:phosphatidate cytidylyltransferase
LAGSASPATRSRYPALPLRLASGILLSVITVAAVWVGGVFFRGLLLVALLVGLWEFLRMGRAAGYPVLSGVALPAGAALVLLVFTGRTEFMGTVLAASGLAAAVLSLRPPLEQRLAGLALTVFGLAYVVGLGIHVFLMRELAHGAELLIVVFAGTWASDTAAFFVGVRFGRTPLAPRISPHKSVEGLWGGIAGAFLVTVGLLRWLVPELEWIPAAAVGLAVGCVAPVGDLLESQIKRNLHVKDTSTLIPGHGGMLDRIDSILFSVPVAYHLLRFLVD